MGEKRKFGWPERARDGQEVVAWTGAGGGMKLKGFSQTNSSIVSVEMKGVCPQKSAQPNGGQTRRRGRQI